jgi:hypothetical protein
MVNHSFSAPAEFRPKKTGHEGRLFWDVPFAGIIQSRFKGSAMVRLPSQPGASQLPDYFY